MRKHKYQGVACLVLAFAPISSFAGAADLGGGPKTSASVPAWEPATINYTNPAIWSGAYAGISAGYGWGHSEQLYDRAGNHGLASTNPTGVVGAVTLGYNYQLSNSGIVLGMEGDIGLMDLNADDKAIFDGHVMKTTFGPWWATVRGRAGYAFDRTLVYGSGGAAFMGVDEISIGNTPGETAINRDTRSGWVVGGGIEHAFAPNMSAKVEYLHMDFGRYEGLSANNEQFHFDNTADLVRAGVNYKF